jgi:vacuolar protein sorting-associated protein 13A/C
LQSFFICACFKVFFCVVGVSHLLLLGRRLKIQIQQCNEEKSNAAKVIQLYVPYWLDTKKCPPLKYKLVAIGQHADKKGEYTGDLGLRKLKALSAEAAADLDQMENSPTMLSSFDCRSLELSVALADSAEAVFGPATPLQALDEADGSVELHAIDDEGSYFRFLVTTTSSPFHSGQTKVVRIRPYMTFTNRLGQELILRQNSVNQARTLKASDSRVSFPFQETENAIMLQIQLAGSQWSHPFAIQKEESLHLMIRHDNGLRQSVQVDVRGYEDGSRFLVFFRLGSSRGPYRIENRTKFRRIKFRQAGLDEEAWQTLRPHSTTSFAWEHPQGLQLLEVVADGMEASDALKYDINKTGNQPVLTFDGVTSSSVCVRVLELGEIKAVRFFDQELEVVDAGSSSNNKEGKEIILAREGSAEAVQEDEVKRDVPSQLEIVFGIEKFGLSVIDHKPQEILFLSLQKVGITYSAGLGQENISRLKVMVRYIQLDNQLPLAAMPVLLAPETGNENEESVVKATINVYNDNSNVIAVYPYIGIRVTQSAWQINVHEPIIWAVMEMFKNLHLDRLSSDSEVVQVDPEIRIELIDVSEVRLKLTLETAPEQRPRGTLGIWSPVVTTIGNISKMPVRFLNLPTYPVVSFLHHMFSCSTWQLDVFTILMYSSNRGKSLYIGSCKYLMTLEVQVLLTAIC